MLNQPHDPEEFANALPAEVPVNVAEAVVASRGHRIVKIVSSFLLGQGSAQGIALLTGIFLIHNMSVEAYAQYGVATAFQTVFSVLVDLGFASTIIPLVGDRVDDTALVGRYVRAARHLRDRTFWILAPVAAVSFLAIVHKRHWPWPLQLLLLGSILLSLHSGGMVSFFSAPLLLRRRLRDFYLPQVISSSGRMLLYAALSVAGALGAAAAAILGAVNITLNGLLIRKAAHRYMLWPKAEDPEAERELLRYVYPAVPAIIFSAFQSQITLFLISIFGSTMNIAEVSALGRLGQIFTALMLFNTIVIEPYLAKVARARLLQTYCGVAALVIAGCAPLVLIGFHWPGVFLFILGRKFYGLQPVIGWYVLSACISFFAGTIWIMNRARRWVFWSGSFLEVALLLLGQIAFLVTVGVHTTQQAIFFSLASALCVTVSHAYVSVVGFAQAGGAQEIPA